MELNSATGKFEKQVWRQPLDEERDLCFPMLPGGFVKTVWLNDRRDRHATLRRDKFVGSFQWRGIMGKFGTRAPAA